MIIKSKDNSIVKIIKKLSKRKYRDLENKYIIESKKMIDEALKSNIDVEAIIVREDIISPYKNSIILDKKLFNSLSSFVTPDGYMAIVNKKTSKLISNKVLILDKLQDPGNLGTLIRSSEAFGFETIISINSVDFYNEKVLRASMGSIFRLNLIESNYDDLSNILEHEVLIADMNGEDYRNIKSLDKLAIVIGNEGRGISGNIKKLRHKLVKIPMKGRVESLNAGVSGSILMSKFS